MPLYHISPKTKKPSVCRAKTGKCPYLTTSEYPHFTSYEEAMKSVEEREAQHNPSTTAIRKKRATASVQKASSNVSYVSDLCEKAMVSDEIDEFAEKITETDDSKRVLALRGLDKNEIAETLVSWQNDLRNFVERKTGRKDFTLITENIGGNSAMSDFTAVDENGEILMNLEAKFGSATNAAAGLKRVSDVVGTDAFTLTAEDKAELIKIYYSSSDKQQVLDRLSTKMHEYATAFNAQENTVSSEQVYDLVRSSGKQGNSTKLSNYAIVNFRRNNGVATVSETEMSIAPDEKWQAQCSVSTEQGVVRISYQLVSEDEQKRIKILFNNKNSLYTIEENGTRKVVNKKGYDLSELDRIPSKFQLGVGSYNVWYEEGQKTV